ncbi:hypothetical protein A0H81_08210 [Grifola frondosa]|uniref:Uncharacterized protein n=1 Tax=Grifola frondosa TaxID=5627 RepID=A0A1C7M5X5_GRIFR|nr:hypothetical protein A0H81_08210 [Grifola frondosa]
MTPYDAIVFPADDRAPHLVALMTSALTIPMGPGAHVAPARCGRMPHPEMYMDYIAELAGLRPWKFHLVEALDGMNKKFATPYIIFYPTISRDGMPFPVNKCILPRHSVLVHDRCFHGRLPNHQELSFNSCLPGEVKRSKI